MSSPNPAAIRQLPPELAQKLSDGLRAAGQAQIQAAIAAKSAAPIQFDPIADLIFSSRTTAAGVLERLDAVEASGRTPELVSARSSTGQCVLIQLCRPGAAGASPDPAAWAPVFSRLRAFGFDFNRSDVAGRTALAWAAVSGKSAFVPLLLALGADPWAGFDAPAISGDCLPAPLRRSLAVLSDPSYDEDRRSGAASACADLLYALDERRPGAVPPELVRLYALELATAGFPSASLNAWVEKLALDEVSAPAAFAGKPASPSL